MQLTFGIFKNIFSTLGSKDPKNAKIKSLERLEVRIITFNETVVQKNWVKTLYRHGKPLEEELAFSDLAGGRTNSASQLRQEINCRVIDCAQCLQCDWLLKYQQSDDTEHSTFGISRDPESGFGSGWLPKSNGVFLVQRFAYEIWLSYQMLKTARSYLHSSARNIGTWQNDRRTDGRTDRRKWSS